MSSDLLSFFGGRGLATCANICHELALSRVERNQMLDFSETRSQRHMNDF